MNQSPSEKNDKQTCLLNDNQNQKLDEHLQSGNTPQTHHSPKTFKPGMAICFTIVLMIGFWAGVFLNSPQDNVSVLSYNSNQSESESQSQNKATTQKSSKKSSSSSSKSSSSKKDKSSSSSSSKAKKAASSSGDSSEPSDESFIPEVIPPDAIGNTPSNILNGGFMAVHDGWIYTEGINHNHYLYKQQSINDSPEQITDQAVGCIGIVGNTLYTRLGNRDYQLTQMDLDGNVNQQWIVGNDSINVFSDHIITSDPYGVYFINQDGIAAQIYAGRISQCCAYEDRVYFIENGNLCSIDESGNDLTIHAENVQQYSVSDNGLYYISQNELFSADTNEPLENIPHLCSLNVNDGVIYFGNLDDGAKLYSVPVSGGEPSKLSDQPAKAICVMDGVIATKWGDDVTFVS